MMVECLAPCLSHGRPRWNCKLLLQSSAVRAITWGVSQWMQDLSFSVFPSQCVTHLTSR